MARTSSKPSRKKLRPTWKARVLVALCQFNKQHGHRRATVAAIKKQVSLHSDKHPPPTPLNLARVTPAIHQLVKDGIVVKPDKLLLDLSQEAKYGISRLRTKKNNEDGESSDEEQAAQRYLYSLPGTPRKKTPGAKSAKKSPAVKRPTTKSPSKKKTTTTPHLKSVTSSKRATSAVVEDEDEEDGEGELEGQEIGGERWRKSKKQKTAGWEEIEDGGEDEWEDAFEGKEKKKRVPRGGVRERFVSKGKGKARAKSPEQQPPSTSSTSSDTLSPYALSRLSKFELTARYTGAVVQGKKLEEELKTVRLVSDKAEDDLKKVSDGFIDLQQVARHIKYRLSQYEDVHDVEVDAGEEEYEGGGGGMDDFVVQDDIGGGDRGREDVLDDAGLQPVASGSGLKRGGSELTDAGVGDGDLFEFDDPVLPQATGQTDDSGFYPGSDDHIDHEKTFLVPAASGSGTSNDNPLTSTLPRASTKLTRDSGSQWSLTHPPSPASSTGEVQTFVATGLKKPVVVEVEPGSTLPSPVLSSSPDKGASPSVETESVDAEGEVTGMRVEKSVVDPLEERIRELAVSKSSLQWELDVASRGYQDVTRQLETESQRLVETSHISNARGAALVSLRKEAEYLKESRDHTSTVLNEMNQFVLVPTFSTPSSAFSKLSSISLLSQFDALNAELDGLSRTRQDEVTNLTAALENTQQINSEMADKLQHAEAEEDRLVQLSTRLDEELDSARTTLESSTIRPTIDVEVGTGPDPEKSKLKAEFLDSILEFDDQQRAIRDLRRSLKRVVEEKNELELKEESLSVEVGSLERHLEDLLVEQQNLERKVEALTAELASLSSTHSALVAQETLTSSSLAQAEQDLEQTRGQIATSAVEYEDKIHELEVELAQAVDDLNSAREGVEDERLAWEVISRNHAVTVQGKELKLAEGADQLSTMTSALEQSVQQHATLSQQIHKLAASLASDPSESLAADVPPPTTELDQIAHHITLLRSELATNSSTLDAALTLSRSVLLAFPPEFNLSSSPDPTIIQVLHDVDACLESFSQRYAETQKELDLARIQSENREVIFGNISKACEELEAFSNHQRTSLKEDIPKFLHGVKHWCGSAESMKVDLAQEVGRLLGEKNELEAIASEVPALQRSLRRRVSQCIRTRSIMAETTDDEEEGEQDQTRAGRVLA